MDNFNCPISQTRLRQISNDACDSALATATAYNHAQTAAWNDTIINSVLKALVSESQTAAGSADTRYKFCVNSTIIQHLSDPRPSGTTSTGTDTEKTAGDAAVEGEAEEELMKEVGGGGESEDAAAAASNKAASNTGGPGRRGMHSASGAYWNNAKDGMWSHKYEGGEAKGMDIVIAIMWIAA
ncbi:hypothetical protein KC338_g2070 [Hortaea werneckii]|uniref:Dynein light chain n=1 Tax=Hortaea werneckii TaxID=91943 RepID=A0A3M7GNN4_HORWE|nr:hypothetical protein KC323_g2008 [Hortaea werneckii]KAI6872615.1 hypothetical protein KC338_g2070 [Hortaea werneckii]KAI7356809.1 hypothetical protein KC320_g2075 [Hortaea werneckii]RMZ02704.1 hypothetical protein D0862_05935 [Hortaea werneckii]